ncbi:MAG: ribonuclease HII [Ilumatobacteraceae bacterium]
MPRGDAPSRAIEEELRAQGFETVVGIDEVGRGAWAGPLVVGAAVLPLDTQVPGVRDSKMLSEDGREAIFDQLADWCVAWSTGLATYAECDELGMAAAQKLACRRAIESLGVVADAAVSDGKWDFVSPSVRHVEMRVKADRDCLSVAAASILAKVVRDREMRRLADLYPLWSFESNKGYPCAVHRAALQGFGPSAIHRRTWVFMDNFVPWSGCPRIERSAQQRLW